MVTFDVNENVNIDESMNAEEMTGNEDEVEANVSSIPMLVNCKVENRFRYRCNSRLFDFIQVTGFVEDLENLENWLIFAKVVENLEYSEILYYLLES